MSSSPFDPSPEITGSIIETPEDTERHADFELEKRSDPLKGKRTARYRPLLRPPMALLRIWDDGADSYETVRIRKSPFCIGRTEGDVTIPHDNQISGRHAQIIRQIEEDDYVWRLQDVGSTNGTFVRAARIVLKPGQVIIIGSRRFDSTEPGQEPEDGGGAINQTLNNANRWQQMNDDGLADLVPQLIDVTKGGSGATIGLADKKNLWIGSDPAQAAIYLDDPMADPRHARVQQDDRGRWCIFDNNSLNGIWMQVHDVNLHRGGYFMCGEQRFSVKVL